MLPPAPSVCQAWQKNLEDLVFASFSPTDSTAFSDPTSSNSAVSGTGCEIEAAISGNTEDSAPKTVSDIGQMFYNAGFSLNNGFDNIPGDPTSVFFPQNCPGFGRSYQKDDLYVFLSASYCPATGDPSSPISRAPGAPGVRGYTLRLIFSSNLVQTQFNHFLSLWAAGDNTAINSLSPALRRRFLNIQELDLMAGLSRSPSKTIQFTWQPVQNTGNSLKTEVVARVSDSRSLLSKPLPAFQMVLASENGQWAVSDASKTTVASSTEDSVILADAQGQIIQLSLANGLTTPLSAPGVYLPLVGSTNGFPSQISPDGHWLTLMQPGPGLQAGTWLVALDGRTALHFNNHDLNLAWSPDSLKIAYFDPIDPQVLKITTLSTGATATLARLNEIPISLAWSPAGDKIAVTYVESRLIFNPSGSAGTSTFVNIGLIPLASPKIQVLAQVEANMNTLSPGDLYWTPDGQELWYGPGEVAFNIRDGSAYPLIGQPLSGELANQQADLLHFVQPGQLLTHSPVSLLSPDWQNLAEVYSTTNSTNDYLAILPAAGSNSSPKNQCCLEYLGGIATFAWTGDGKDVVVYNGINGPGNLLLVNPTSGERQTAAEGIYYIGLVSSLKQAGLKLAPTVTVSRSPSTDISQTWSWVNNLVSGISLQVPTGWSVWQPGKDYAQGPVVVANFNFDNPFGFASLKPGDLYFKISKVPMGVGQTAAGWYSQIEAINQSGQIYEPVTIGGLRGFHRVMHVDLVPKDEFMLPVGDAIVVIDKYPLISDYDLVFKQILATLSFH